ncbi:MAG: protogloblin ApPgb [Polyangiaceae bacterium]|nr:protogloblin ApPgb [Polyangiaceae bacterium]MCB9610016.1 protogloblin ApPgb [Polyangiaceae bacterium]
MTSIPGYTHGSSSLVRSPITLADFDRMQKSVLFDAEDVRYLHMSHDVVKDYVEEILDVWYGFVGSQPHLLASFTNPKDGQPIPKYLEAVRKRFGRWILDTASARYDQAWLDYQHEIGLRHHRTKKNQTDGADSTAIVPFRDLFALVFPVTFTLRPFLGKAGHSSADVERMYQAWLKACLLQVTLWSHPYVKDGDF